MNSVLMKTDYSTTITNWLDTLNRHSSSTFKHSIRVGELLYHFSSFLKMEDAEQLYTIGVLHDIGKIYIPQSLLNKTSTLTNKEIERIRLHTEYGEEIIDSIEQLQHYSKYIKFHHENFDGSGYYGVKEEEIPLVSRMIRIIDTYDAMINGRIYQKSKQHDEIISELNSLSGKLYDPGVVKLFDFFINDHNNN